MQNAGTGACMGRFTLYILGKVLALLLAAAVVALAFFSAIHTLDVSVMVKDAFTKTASVVLRPVDNDDTELLSRLFSRDYLDKTGLDTQMDNQYYDVLNYYQRTDVPLVIVFPWENKKTLVVTDVIEDVRAELVKELPEDFTPKTSLIQSGKYEVTVVKDADGAWMVDDIELIEVIQPESTLPLPTPTASEEAQAPEEDMPDETVDTPPTQEE